jgi:hypothetical protein
MMAVYASTGNLIRLVSTFPSSSLPAVLGARLAMALVALLGAAGIADPATPAWIRPVLQSCVDRTRELVPDVH